MLHQMWERDVEGNRIVDVLARTDVVAVAARRPAPRAPWQTRFTALTAVPTGGVRHVAPIVIPVIGGKPIDSRHLVRAPWAEPLAAFAGVIVETRLVPDAWLTPRSAARRAVDPPMAAIQPAVPAPPAPAAAGPRPYVAIPILPERGAVPVRVVPVMARPAPGPRPAPAAMTALGRSHASVSATSAAPIEPVVPSPVASTPAPTRRGLLGRAVVFAAGLVVSLVAVEAAARLGRR